jgi:hypothetical protein
LVWYPRDPASIPDGVDYQELLFKSKGGKHAVVKQRQAAQVSAEKVQGIEDFVAMFVTQQRLEQVLAKTFGETSAEAKGTGRFIAALQQDVLKESEAELEAAALSWKEVSKEVCNAARKWFLEVGLATWGSQR